MRCVFLCCLGALLAAAEALPVITGNSLLLDLVQRVGGGRVASSSLVPAGVDPHAYQPVPDDLRRLAAARLVVINGLGFEGWFDRLAGEARFAGSVVVAASGIVPLPADPGDAHQHGDHGHAPAAVADDPHAFTSARLLVRYTENIREALVAADPDDAAGHRARAEALISELRAADAWATEQFAAVPRARRVLVTDHASLAYLAADYGLRLITPRTTLDEGQPSARRVAEIVAAVRRAGVSAVFIEAGRNPRLVEQIASEAGVRVGGRLLVDALDAPGTPGGSAVGAFRQNVETILAGLR